MPSADPHTPYPPPPSTYTRSVPSLFACRWRLCFIVPLVLHLFGAYFALRGQDLPDGNYAALEKQGSKQKGNSSVVIKVGASNINAWILTVTYGFCFGVELTVINVATQYFYEFFALPQAEASAIASIFGLTNIAFRSLGGIMSDCTRRAPMAHASGVGRRLRLRLPLRGRHSCP